MLPPSPQEGLSQLQAALPNPSAFSGVGPAGSCKALKLRRKVLTAIYAQTILEVEALQDALSLRLLQLRKEQLECRISMETF